jgi:hypothetical protein
MTPYSILSHHPRIMPRLVGPEPQLAIQLLTSARPDLLASNNHQTSATATILIWQGDEEHGIPAARANLLACLFGWREPLLTTARSLRSGGADASPHRGAYTTLRDQAQEAIATAVAATAVPGGGMDLLGSVAGLHPSPPHPRMPCRHPHPHPHPRPQPSRPTTLRSRQIRQNPHHLPALAGWAWIAWVCSRRLAASCSA